MARRTGRNLLFAIAALLALTAASSVLADTLVLDVNGDGAIAQWIYVGAADYTAVTTDDGDTSYASNNKANQVHRWTTETTAQTGTVNSVTVWAVARREGGDEEISLLLNNTGSSGVLGITAAYAAYSNTWTTDPDGGAWDFTKINNLSIGAETIKTGGGGFSSELRVTRIWVEVDYTPTTNTPPTVTITAPADASTFNQGDTINFTGTASDAEDGNLTASLTWTSSLDGTIGTGGSFLRSDLSPGTHTITAEVTDSGLLTGNDQITITVNATPVVTVTAPADASTFDEGENVDFTGTATDAEDGTLTANLTWTSSLDGTIGTGGSFSRSDLSVGTHTITASVTDSGGAAGQDQITLTINAIPVVTITSPPSSSTFNQGDSVSFAGTAADTEDGTLTASLTWTSSLDGTIGTGGSFSRSDLSPGTHTITASVTDSDGATGQDQISITINANNAPVVTITAPSGGANFTQGDNVDFTGTATDVEDGDITASLAWTSSIDGSIGTGGSFSRTDLSVGTHTITASVTDSGGAGGQDQISITIDPPPANEVTPAAPTAGIDSCNQITVTVTYTGDDNGDSTTAFQWSLNGNPPWTTIPGCEAVAGPSPRVCVDTSVVDNSTNWYRVDFTDPDGVIGTDPSAAIGPYDNTSFCGVDGTTAGAATLEVASCNQLTVSAAFSGDDNRDGSILVEYSLAGLASWQAACSSVTGPSPRECSIPGLSENTAYDVQITFTDPDGVAPDINLDPNNELIVPVPGSINTGLCDGSGDDTPPTVLVLAPQRDGTIGGTDQVKVQVFDATLDASGVTVEWSVDSQNEVDLLAAVLNGNYDCGANCGVYEFAIDTVNGGANYGPLGQGAHYFTVKVADNAGNIARVQYGFQVNNTGTRAAGDGLLLRRTRGSQVCIDCHNLPTHSSQSTSGDYGNWAVGCVACHTPHRTKNVDLVREEIETPHSGKRSVRFEARGGAVATTADTAGAASYANEDAGTAGSPAAVDGPCQVCHTRTSDSSGTVARWRNSDAGGNADTHFTSSSTTPCTDCHTHDAGFSGAGGACDSCHFAPPTVGKHGSHDEVGTVPDDYTNLTPSTTPTQYGIACAKCHSGSHFSSPGPPHTVEVVFDDSVAPTNPGGTYTPDGPSQATDPGVNGDGWLWSDGTCANLYCHSNAAPLGGTDDRRSPTWDSAALTCAGCHNTAASDDTGGTATDLSDSHGKHIQSTSGETGSYAIKCDECHAQTIQNDPADPWNLTSADFSSGAGQGKVQHVDGGKDVFFSTTATAGGIDQSGGVYNGTPNFDCSGTYCHSQGTAQSAPFAAPNVSLGWDGDTSTCRSCHSGDATTTPTLDSGSHEFHVNNAAVIGTNYECATCHDSTVSAGDNETITGLANHVDGTKTVTGTRVDATYTSPTCTASYCHSSGQAPPPATTSFEYYTANWETGPALDCAGCHGRHSEDAFTSTAGEPNYTNDGAGTADANSHQRHVTAATDCTNCHNTTTTTGTSILASAPHTDQTRDVVIAPAFDTGDPNYTAASKTCQNIACHGTGTPQWGDTLVCLDCHDGPDGGTLGDGTPNGVGDEWNNAGATGPGHGTAGYGNFASTGGANPSTLGGCDYCHDLGSSHTPTAVANPYRLRFSATDNTLCLQCHATGDNGIQLNSEGTALNLIDSSLDVDTAHFGTKHQTGEGGELCWDCHDPHGVPSNILMTKLQVSKASDPYGVPGTTVTVTFTDNTTPGQAVGRFTEATNNPRQGICQACHDPASGNGDETTDLGPTKYWRSDGTDNPDGPGGDPPATSTHNAGVLCSDCHEHNNDFAGAGGDCLGCHGDASGAAGRRAVESEFAKNSHHVGASVGPDGSPLFTQPNMGGALTNFDCVVCHAEGKVVSDGQGGFETDTTDQPHQDGVINLRNADSTTAYFDYDKDSITAAANQWMSGNSTWETQTSTALDPFCMSCHDSDGASATFNNGTNEGLGFTGSAGNPFADSAITNEYDQQPRGSVVNIRNKVDAWVDDSNNPITPVDREGGGEPRTADGRPDPTQGIYARHAIRGSGIGSVSVYGSSQIPTNRWETRPAGGSWNDTSVMGCADCHTTDGANTTAGNAHGSNTEYLLKNKDGLATAEPDFDIRNVDVSQINCYKCHTWQWYARERNFEHTDNNSDWVFTASGTGDAGRRTGNGNIFGLPCTSCHGGVGWGNIHGTSQTFTINAGPAQRQAYRFMNGASLRYYDPGDWNASSVTCYTLSDGEVAGDSWGSCSQHDPGNGKPWTRPVTRDIQY